MYLFNFIHELLEQGSVTVKGTLQDFTEADLLETRRLLTDLYHRDVLDMPLQAPPFSEAAALWAAQHLHDTVQLTILRDLGEEAVRARLIPFSGQQDAAAIYTADLLLRRLPVLLPLAKGFAPGDVLVELLLQTAVQWPFSSVGMELPAPVDDRLVLQHPSLRRAYADRIIQHKDTSRLVNPLVQQDVKEITGDYSTLLWPQLKTILNPS